MNRRVALATTLPLIGGAAAGYKLARKRRTRVVEVNNQEKRAFDKAVLLLKDTRHPEKLAHAFEEELEKIAIFGLLARGAGMGVRAAQTGVQGVQAAGGLAAQTAGRLVRGISDGARSARSGTGNMFQGMRQNLSTNFQAGLHGRSVPQQIAHQRLQAAIRPSQQAVAGAAKAVDAPKPSPVKAAPPPAAAAPPNPATATASPSAVPPPQQVPPPAASTPTAGAAASGAAPTTTSAAAQPIQTPGGDFLGTHFGITPEVRQALSSSFAKGSPGFSGGKKAIDDWWAKLRPEQQRNILATLGVGSGVAGAAGGYAAGAAGGNQTTVVYR